MKSDRNHYVDFAKLIFAFMIVEFHTTQRVFPNGRIAVEGFFMLSGFLMMRSLSRTREFRPRGDSLLRFLSRKWQGIIIYILPAAVIGSFLMYDSTVLSAIKRLHNLLFVLVPLSILGFTGINPLGISWYISSMFVSMAILYPLVRRFGERFSLTTAPLISVFSYGYLCQAYHTIAINHWDANLPVSTGLLRGIAGISAGVFIWELSRRISHCSMTRHGRIISGFIELACVCYIYYLNLFHPKSGYDYYAIFYLFFVLLIGLSHLSVFEPILRAINTRAFGTISTLLVMTHWSLMILFKRIYGDSVFQTGYISLYWAELSVFCLIVWLASLCIQKAFEHISLFIAADPVQSSPSPD